MSKTLREEIEAEVRESRPMHEDEIIDCAVGAARRALERAADPQIPLVLKDGTWESGKLWAIREMGKAIAALRRELEESP